MQRIRKENGKAIIKIILDAECSIDEVDVTLEKLRDNLLVGCEAMVENLRKYEEVKVDKDMNFSGKRKLPTPE